MTVSCVTHLTTILRQDVELVSVNVEDSGGEVRVGRELALELVQRPAVKQVAAAALAQIRKDNDKIRNSLRVWRNRF